MQNARTDRHTKKRYAPRTDGFFSVSTARRAFAPAWKTPGSVDTSLVTLSPPPTAAGFPKLTSLQRSADGENRQVFRAPFILCFVRRMRGFLRWAFCFFRGAAVGALRVPNGMPVRWGKTSDERIDLGKRRFLTNVCPQIIWR